MYSHCEQDWPKHPEKTLTDHSQKACYNGGSNPVWIKLEESTMRKTFDSIYANLYIILDSSASQDHMDILEEDDKTTFVTIASHIF